MRVLTRVVLVALVALLVGCTLFDSPAPATPTRPQPAAVPTQDATSTSTSAVTPAYQFKHGVIERDITYCTNGGVALKMDVRYPTGMSRPAPILVYVHGGSWSSGDKTDAIGMTDVPELLSRGYLVASVDYRHAPEWKFPAQIEDVKCAIRFLRANAARFNLDPNQIGAWGHSAGGHLVALLGLTDKSDGFEGSSQYLDQSSRVEAVVDLCGRADLKGMPADKAESVFGAADNSSPLLERGSPITFVSKGDAPFLIFHGDKDDVVPLQVSEKLAGLLKAAGISATLVVVKNGDHMFRPQGGPISPTRADMTRMMADFFDQHLR